MSETSARYQTESEDRLITSMEQRILTLEEQVRRLVAENADLQLALDGAVVIATIAGKEIAKLRAQLEI